MILASKPFEEERPLRSWFELTSTLVVYGGCMALVLGSSLLPLRVAAAVLAGLVQFRIFALFHEHIHGALLASSPVARWIMSGAGVFILTPRQVWKETHNFHHWNNGKLEWTSIGSYPVLTTEQYAGASEIDRRKYERTRHPLAIIAGYFTVGIGGMCISAFRRSPKRHWVGPVALVLHVVALAWLAWALGPLTATLVLIVPVVINHALASYMFYAQHNFPQTKFFERGSWNYTEAALHGSSYMEMGSFMRWVTSNLGYHHVHHLNSKIPGYRLPEAMAAIEELQSPHRTSFHPRDVLACLRLHTWDPGEQRMRTASEPVAEPVSQES